jgi:hypothetical protein
MSPHTWWFLSSDRIGEAFIVLVEVVGQDPPEARVARGMEGEAKAGPPPNVISAPYHFRVSPQPLSLHQEEI